MLLRLFLLFVLLPLTDLALLAWLTWQTSWMVTLAVVLVPAVAGAFLVRWEGPRRVRSAGKRMARGDAPAAEVLDGTFVVLAGVLLISPGVLTDVAGLILLVPSVRRSVRRRLSRTIRARMIRVVSAISPSADVRDTFEDGTVVDVESRPPQP